MDEHAHLAMTKYLLSTCALNTALIHYLRYQSLAAAIEAGMQNHYEAWKAAGLESEGAEGFQNERTELRRKLAETLTQGPCPEAGPK